MTVIVELWGLVLPAAGVEGRGREEGKEEGKEESGGWFRREGRKV